MISNSLPRPPLSIYPLLPPACFATVLVLGMTADFPAVTNHRVTSPSLGCFLTTPLSMPQVKNFPLEI